MIDPTTAIAGAQKLSWAIEQLSKVVKGLKADPDVAAAKLAEALDEIAKTYQVVDVALSEYVTMAFDDDALQHGAGKLVELEGGRLSVMVEKGRGHCTVVQNIYQRHLDAWFNRALNTADYAIVHEVFDTFHEGDVDAFLHMSTITGEVESDASEALNLVSNGETDRAREHILDAYRALRPLRQEIAKAMKNLYSLKNEFIELSGAVI